MKKPSQDVFLNDGCGYVVESRPYKRHLQSSTESTQVSPSHIAFSHSLSHLLLILSDQLVPITRLSIRQIRIAEIWKLLVLVHVHVLAMDVFFHTQLLIFRKERGQINTFSFCAIS